jgi:hypothetical protein
MKFIINVPSVQEGGSKGLIIQQLVSAGIIAAASAEAAASQSFGASPLTKICILYYTCRWQ